MCLNGMLYNISFNVAAIANLAVVLFSFIVQKKIPEQKNRMFFYLGTATLCSAIVDVISALELSGVIAVPRIGLWVINEFYYIFVCSIPFFFSLYALALTEQMELLKKIKWKIIYFFPIIIEIVLIALTPSFNLVFDISESGEYIRRTGVFILYGLLLYQIGLSLFVITYFKDKIDIHSKAYIFIFVGLTLTGVLIQFIVPRLLIQHFTISISLLLFFTSFQFSEIVTDPITGVLNLKAFNRMMKSHFKHHQRFSVISIHLDDIQFIGATFGIEAQNFFLTQIGSYLQTLIQSYSTASSMEYKVYHIDNDLFSISLPEDSDAEQKKIIGDIFNRFEKPWKCSLVEIKTTVRICVIECPKDASNTEEINDVISSSKTDTRYKNEKLLYASNIDVKSRKRYAYIEQLIKTAIQEHRIAVMYQPLFSTEEQRIIGAEALVRMKDHEGKFVSPDEFIPIAEQDGNILRIGLYVYEEVCRFVATRKLKKLGIKMIDVNLSVAQCMQTKISDEFKLILDSFNLEPWQICLEITETASAHTPELLYLNMQKFHELGFPCSLDDYGTGYANLDYMLHMPFSMVKIDKEIVESAMKDEKAYVMLVGIIDMIHKLGMKTVAEGIETKEMVDKLTELKCDYLQGYYYSKPIPEDQFLEMILAQCPSGKETLFEDVEELESVDDVEELEEV
ncbi:MAG: EAL domain-containing protein [Treponema sp.]|nr:EAL domain-containing protein [Treponema sp.]